MGAFRDLTGMSFGKLKVIEKVDRNKSGNWRWRCKCECANETIVAGPDLIRGRTISCGCALRETARKNARERFSTHHETKSRLYKLWSNIKANCYNENSRDYHLYGALGIEMCSEWKESYEAFRDWSLANGYHEKLTLDRIDDKLDYTPENCVWVPMKHVANNVKRDRCITFGGESHNLTEWSKITGIPADSIRFRLNNGWSIEASLWTPIGKTPYNGQILRDQDGFMVLNPIKGVISVDAAITKYRSDRDLW